MDIQLIIFDFDGTLSDTKQTIVRTFQATLQRLGMEEKDEETCASTIGLPLKDCFLQLFPNLDEAAAQQCVDTYRTLFEENKKTLAPSLFPHVKETLAHIHERPIRMSIASSRSVQSLHDFVHDMKLEGYFSCVLGADNVAKAKPDPTPVLETWKQIPVDPQHTLVVGDMPVDILMGRRAGALTCGVTYGNASADQLKEAGADFLIDDFADLLTLLS